MFPISKQTCLVPAFAAVCLAAATLSGCSSDRRVLARVGDRTISVAEYRELAASVADRYVVPPDTARVLLLDDLVRRELMLLAARGNPATADSYVAQRRAEIEKDALSRALLEELTPRNVGVSDAEVRRLYLWRQKATHCKIVLTMDSSLAGRARHAIDAGEDFASVAQRFDVTGTLPPGGDLGFIEPGSLVTPLDGIVRESPVGSVVGPVEAPGLGWFVVKIVAREPREHGPLEQQAPELRGMLQQRKQRVALLARYAALRNEYHVEPDPEGIQLMYHRLNAAQQLRSFGADAGATQLTPAERAAVVGRWDGGAGFRGELTLGEAMDDLAAGRGARLMPTRLDSYEAWVRNAVLQRVAVTEARRRHLHEMPAIAERIRKSVNDLVLQAVYQTEVLDRAEPNDEEVQETYERNAPALAHLKSATVEHATLPDSALAARAAVKAMDSGSLKQAVLVTSPGSSAREETIRFPTQDPIWQMLQPGLTRQSIGGFLGPVQTPEGWRVVQILARDAPIPAFDDLPAPTQQGLRQQARELASERRLKFFTDSLRAVTPVFVDRELLRRIPWPVPAGIQFFPGTQGS